MYKDDPRAGKVKPCLSCEIFEMAVYYFFYFQEDISYEHLAGIPKALLPGVGGKRILDFWWEAIKT